MFVISYVILYVQVREYFGQFVSKQAQSVIDDILAKRMQVGGIGGMPGMPGIIHLYVCMYACMHVYMHACMYVSMHVCVYILLYACKSSVSQVLF